MNMTPIAQSLAAQGRNGDSMLVHMTPSEVGGLQALAQSAGGSLSTNPTTGMPEANFLQSILPTIIGAGLSFIPGVGPLMAAGIVGGGQTLLTGDLNKGLMAGLGAFGGAGIGTTLAGMGSAAQAGAGASGAALIEGGTSGIKGAAMEAGSLAAPGAVSSNVLGAGAQQAFANPGAFGSQLMSNLGGPLGAGAAGLGALGSFGAFDQPQTTLPTTSAESTYEGPYMPVEREVRYPDPMSTATSEFDYFTPSNPTPGFQPFAQGGEVDQTSGGAFGGAIEKIKKALGDASGSRRPSSPPPVGIDSKHGFQTFAQGGLAEELQTFGGQQATDNMYAFDFNSQRLRDEAEKMRTLGREINASIPRPEASGAATSLPPPVATPAFSTVEQLHEQPPLPPPLVVPPAAQTQDAQTQDAERRQRTFNLLAGVGGSGFFGRGNSVNPLQVGVSTGGNHNAAGGLIGKAVGGLASITGGEFMEDGSFVIDARTVAELGNGSSNAGLELLMQLGGRPVEGPGDGVSDSIPATIDGTQDAAVARDEVIFDPQAVAAIGEGSAERGAERLYAMMRQAEQARKEVDRGEDSGAGLEALSIAGAV